MAAFQVSLGRSLFQLREQSLSLFNLPLDADDLWNKKPWKACRATKVRYCLTLFSLFANDLGQIRLESSAPYHYEAFNDKESIRVLTLLPPKELVAQYL